MINSRSLVSKAVEVITQMGSCCFLFGLAAEAKASKVATFACSQQVPSSISPKICSAHSQAAWDRQCWNIVAGSVSTSSMPPPEPVLPQGLHARRCILQATRQAHLHQYQQIHHRRASQSGLRAPCAARCGGRQGHLRGWCLGASPAGQAAAG